MGRPKVKIIDDSNPAVEEKTPKKEKRVKSETDKAIGEVERTQGDEHQGGANDAGTIDEQVSGTTDHNQKSDEQVTEKPKKAQKPGKAKPRSKKYQQISQDLDRSKTYSLNEAVELVKKLSYTKFESTLEAHINTASTGIRGLVALPYASGRKLTILAFGKGAQDCGADLVGNEETIEEINKGKVDFDLLITTPEWMPKLAKVARILGPRGLMPNPKNGTITDDLKKAVTGFQAGKTEYKTESKAAVIHLALGKLSQPNEELMANIKTLLQTVGKTRVKKVTLSPTMGPAVKLDLSSV